MNNNLKSALGNVMENDVKRYESASEHEFSSDFERKIKKLSKSVCGKKASKIIPAKRAAILAAAAAAAFAAGTFAGALSSGFNITKIRISEREGYPMNEFTYSASEDCPETLESIYTIAHDALPEYYSTRRTCINDENTGASTLFMPDYDRLRSDEMAIYTVLNLIQDTKSTFRSRHKAAEYVSYKELTVGGGSAYFITRERFFGQESSLIWDGGDYIFELCGYNLTEEKAVELANSLEVYDKEIINNEITEV